MAAFQQSAREKIKCITGEALAKLSYQEGIVIPGNPGEGRGRPGIQDFK
jgi:hypothetical protein